MACASTIRVSPPRGTDDKKAVMTAVNEHPVAVISCDKQNRYERMYFIDAAVADVARLRTVPANKRGEATYVRVAANLHLGDAF